MGLVQDHDMIEELPANGADEPLRRPILPGTLDRCALRVQTEALDHLGDCGGEDGVVVVDQESMARRIGEGFAQLLAHPLSGGSRCDIEGKDAPSPMIEREPDEMGRPASCGAVP